MTCQFAWFPWPSGDSASPNTLLPSPLLLQIALQNTTSLCNPPDPPQHIFSHTYSQKLVSHPPTTTTTCPSWEKSLYGTEKTELLKRLFMVVVAVMHGDVCQSNIITAVVR